MAPDGTIYFSEDQSDHILRRTPTGVLSIFVDEDDIDLLLGLTADSDNGMDLGPDGTLFVADEDCNCIYTVSPDGNTLEIIVTESAMGMVTGNLGTDAKRGQMCIGEPGADLEGGLVVSPAGVVYFADDGEGCNPARPNPGGFGFDSLDSILSATPDGLGGYDVAIVADEDDIFNAAMSVYPPGYAVCGSNFAGLDVDIDLGDDGFLYVLEDSSGAPPPDSCMMARGGGGGREADDKVLRIDPSTGAVSLLVAASEFGALQGVMGENQADLEGGIAALGDQLFIGDSVSEILNPRGDEEFDTIFRVGTGGGVSVFVSSDALQEFYGPRYPGLRAELNGGLDGLPGVSVLEIPTSNARGLMLLVGLLGVCGLWVVRRM